MEKLHFDNIAQYLLLKNGNYLYKVPFHDGFAVLKLYYGSRGWFRRLYKTFDNVVICGQTSFMPKSRLKTEQKAMAIWKDAGIRVFGIYEDIEVEGMPKDGYALYEYVEGRHFHKLLPDESIPLDERLALYRKFLDQWYKRHKIAVDTKEPMLIHENGDLKHVMDYKDELVWFDFEMCFRSRKHVEDLVSREIMSYVKSLGHFIKDQKLFDIYFNELMENYKGKEFLANTYPVFFQNRNLLVRFGRKLDYIFRKRSKRPFSKYNMAIKIKKYLEQ